MRRVQIHQIRERAAADSSIHLHSIITHLHFNICLTELQPIDQYPHVILDKELAFQRFPEHGFVASQIISQ